MSSPTPDLRHGALGMVVSALLFASMAATIKVASRSLPNTTVVFFRNAVGLLTLLPCCDWGSATLPPAT